MDIVDSQIPPLSSNQIDKVTQRLQFSLSTPSYVLPVSLEHKSQGGFLTWGNDNLYPQWLTKMFYGSALHNAIVLRKRNEIVAKGLFSISGNKKLTAFINDECNDKGDAFAVIFRKIVLDYLIYGGFAIQCIFTKATGKIAEIYYIDYSKLRYNLNADKIKYSKNWGAPRVRSIEYDLFDKNDPTGNKIFIYNGEMTRTWYAIPEYIGALPYIEAQVEIANFNLQNIKNGMAPSLFISIKGAIPTIEEQAAIERQFLEKYSGSANTGRFVIDYSETETPSTSITPIEQNNANDRYLALQAATVDNIFTGHQVTTPSIFGQMVSGKLGIGAELSQGLQIFQNTYVKPNQNILLPIINKLLAINFKDCDLQIQPLDPLDVFFTDQVLIASQMTQEEIRIRLKQQGYITTVGFLNDQKPISEVDTIPKLDTTDKEIAAGPQADKTGADADQAGDNQNGQN